MNQVEIKKAIIKNNKREKGWVIVFYAASLLSIVAVFTISLFLIYKGWPAIKEIGLLKFLFGTTWYPSHGDYGILKMVLTTIVATILALLIATPISILVSVFITYIAPKKIRSFLISCIELLSGIPSVVYGFIGLTIISPWVANIFAIPSGATLFTAVIILTIMILPTVTTVTKTSLESLSYGYYQASLALGASDIETIFKVMVPAAKSGIITAVVLGAGRAIGETMAVIMVSGNVVNWPGIFESVRFMTSGIAYEMNYALGVHRSALFAIGVVLFMFIFILDFVLYRFNKKVGDR